MAKNSFPVLEVKEPTNISNIVGKLGKKLLESIDLEKLVESQIKGISGESVQQLIKMGFAIKAQADKRSNAQEKLFEAQTQLAYAQARMANSQAELLDQQLVKLKLETRTLQAKTYILENQVKSPILKPLKSDIETG